MPNGILSFPQKSVLPEHKLALVKFMEEETFLTITAAAQVGQVVTSLETAYYRGWSDALQYAHDMMAKRFAG